MLAFSMCDRTQIACCFLATVASAHAKTRTNDEAILRWPIAENVLQLLFHLWVRHLFDVFMYLTFVSVVQCSYYAMQVTG